MGAGGRFGRIVAVPVRAEQNVVIDGVEWRVNYTGDYLPNDPLSDPAWTELFTNGDATASVNDGILTFEALANVDQAWTEMVNTTFWNGNSDGIQANTVEFRMKLRSEGAEYIGAGSFIFDGVQYFGFNIVEDDPFTPGQQGYVNLGNGGNIILDVDSYQVYRIVMYGDGMANLFINGVAAYESGVSANGLSGDNRINFGDLLNSGGGTSDWDYFRWTNAGAYNPVPEPQAAALLMMAVGAGFWTLRRKRGSRAQI